MFRRIPVYYICNGILVTATAFFLLTASARTVLAECPPFPEVAWWKDLSHQSARDYVAIKHGGDWNDYINKWEYQYTKIKDIYDRGAAIVVTKDKLRVEGESLKSYAEKVKQRLEIIRCLANESANSPPTTPDAAVVKKNDFIAGRKKASDAGCIKCHGETGTSKNGATPNLAGQNDYYIVKQLLELRKPRPDDDAPYDASERHNRMMDNRAAALSEMDIWNLAAFFSEQQCSSDSQGSSDVARPAKAAPCIKCHGIDGKSIFPEIPNLAGQKKVYLTRQLMAFRTTAGDVNRAELKDERHNYLMAIQSKDLSDTDINVLAEYFSSLACR